MKSTKYSVLVFMIFSFWITNTSFVTETNDDLVIENYNINSGFYDMEFESIDGQIIPLANFTLFIVFVYCSSDTSIFL